MEVFIISVENIKPFRSPSHEFNFKPFKLSKLDQLMPSVYSPLIYFYPSNPNNNNTCNLKLASSKLKSSLSKTLDRFYPLSGRVDNQNMFIHDFDQGVPCTETRIIGQTLSGFLQPPKMELLNNLLPFEPCCILPSKTNGPQIAVQLNEFDCGGIALGLSMHHRIIDGETFSAFLKTWTAIANPAGPGNKVVDPDLVSASSVFPPQLQHQSHFSLPQQPPPQQQQQQQQQPVAGRFVFDHNSISALRSISRSDRVENPSRSEALCAFIWKHAMKAAVDTKSPKPTRFLQWVNIRSRMGQRLSRSSIGNLASTKVVSSTEESSIKELVEVIRNGVEGIDQNYLLNSINGTENWFTDLTTTSTQGNDDKFLGCSSWIGFGFNEFDFGLGKPVWTGLFGDASGNHAAFSNSFILKEVGARARRNTNNNGIEAWITLDEHVMAALELDPLFLDFASPNPSILLN